MTPQEAIKAVICKLVNIRVPAGYIDDIGVPLSEAIHDLMEIQKAFGRILKEGEDNGTDGNLV